MQQKDSAAPILVARVRKAGRLVCVQEYYSHGTMRSIPAKRLHEVAPQHIITPSIDDTLQQMEELHHPVLITKASPDHDVPELGPGYIVSLAALKRIGFPLENTTELNGGVLRRDEFPELYEIISSKFSPITTDPDLFNVPDLRGKVTGS